GGHVDATDVGVAPDGRIDGAERGVHRAGLARVARVAGDRRGIGDGGGRRRAGVAGVGGRGLGPRGARVARLRERRLVGVDAAAVAAVDGHVGDRVATRHGAAGDTVVAAAQRGTGDGAAGTVGAGAGVVAALAAAAACSPQVDVVVDRA